MRNGGKIIKWVPSQWDSMGLIDPPSSSDKSDISWDEEDDFFVFKRMIDKHKEHVTVKDLLDQLKVILFLIDPDKYDEIKNEILNHRARIGTKKYIKIQKKWYKTISKIDLFLLTTFYVGIIGLIISLIIRIME